MRFAAAITDTHGNVAEQSSYNVRAQSIMRRSGAKLNLINPAKHFLGMVAWYQKFISSFTDLAEPLYQLRQKNTDWVWSPKCQTAFDILRCALTSDPILGYPDGCSPFVLHTDASNVGMGAVLIL